MKIFSLRRDLIELSSRSVYEVKSINEVARGKAEATAYSNATDGVLKPGQKPPAYFNGNVDVVPIVGTNNVMVYTFVGDGVITYQEESRQPQEQTATVPAANPEADQILMTT